MHIEPEIIQGAKIALSYSTAIVSFGLIAKSIFTDVTGSGFLSLGVKSLLTSLMVLGFFEVLPHHSVGISEVHFILGSSLFLLFGAAPAAVGLSAGLLIQGLFFAPQDLPMYWLNVTTLIMPLFAMSLLAKKLIPENTAYKDISYAQALGLSVSYQGGIITWVAFWAFYGQGFSSENVASVFSFCVAYSSVIMIEPVIDLALLACAKRLNGNTKRNWLNPRLYKVFDARASAL